MAHTINTPLLRKTLEHITLNRSEWNQHVWFGFASSSHCGTAGCLAGHAAVLSGVPLAYTYSRHGNVGVPVMSQDGLPLSAVAYRELGLTPSEADLLFYSHNSLENLWSLAESFTDGDIKACEMDLLTGGK